MKLKLTSDSALEAELDADDMAELGLDADGGVSAVAADAIIAAGRQQLGFRYSAKDCLVSLKRTDSGCTVRIALDRGHGVKRYIMCFEDRDDLIRACRVTDKERVLSSELYEGGGKYYLCFSCDENGSGISFDGMPYWISAMKELCIYSFEDKTAFFYYVEEHYSQVFSKNAVDRIAKSGKQW